MKLLIVNNPISGDVDKTDIVKSARRTANGLGYQVAYFETTGKEDLRRLREKIDKEKPDKIAVFGGDGTFSLGAKATMHSGIPLGVVPCGSANAMARELGVEGNSDSAFEDILQSRYYADLDLIRINGEHYCLHIADVGINADIVADYDRDEDRGMTAYGKYLLKALSDTEPFPVQVIRPGHTLETECVMIGFSNGRKFGTGVPINTVGNPFDGKFEIDIISEMSAIHAVKAGLSAISEFFADGDHRQTLSVSEATVRFDRPRDLQIDGEAMGKFQEVRLEIERGAIQYVTTAANPYLFQ